MPALTGYLPGVWQTQTQDHLRIAPIDAFGGFLFTARGASDNGSLNSGAHTASAPIAVLHGPRSGTLGHGYYDDWYFRIHLYPQAVAIGNLVTQQDHTVRLWNAHFGSRTLSAITPSGQLSGTAIIGLTAPMTFSALLEHGFTLRAYTSGDPVIDGQYAFGFGAETPALKVTGRRVTLWPIRPQWAAGIGERLQWATDVLAARDGTEQRVRLREHARRTLEMDFLAAAADARLAGTLLFGWSGRKYLVPVWAERDILTAPLAAGATSLTVGDAALKDYRVGGYAVLWASPVDCEALGISAIAGNTLTFGSPTARSYPAGASVMPGIVSRIEGETSGRRATDQLFETRIRFLDEQGYDRAAAEIGPAWNGYAVLDERPDRAEDVTETWGRTLEVLDAIAGIVAVDDVTGNPVILRRYSWLLNGRQAIHRWKAWAAARAGRLKALWLPTFADDLAVTQTIVSTASYVDVGYAALARYVGAHPLRQAIRIETTDGQVFHRQITGVTELSEAEERLSLDASLGVTLAPSQIRRVMWLGLARLDSDAVEIHHETDGIARLSATFRIVQQ